MPYTIELVSIGENLYPLIEESAERLNKIQDSFRFRAVPSNERGASISFGAGAYTNSEVFAQLESHKQLHGGRRPYLIAFVNKPLSSEKLTNLFGSLRAGKGLAVVTLHDANRFVRHNVRYCCYFLVRYALSFINPSIRNHDDQARAYCYFHLKRYKPDIRVSILSGQLCAACNKELTLHPPRPGCNSLNTAEQADLKTMLEWVAGRLPHAIIMKGGGVKGLAFASALKVLQPHYVFDQHVGTSAGAITAVLLAAGYGPDELLTILKYTEFATFKDAPWWRVPWNLLVHQGAYPGETFRKWLTTLLAKKITKQGEIVMSDLNRALVYASREGNGAIEFDSQGKRSAEAAAFAARCSMSIPVFFTPVLIGGRRVYDGGLRLNFPLRRFVDAHPKKPFVALYLGTRDLGSRQGFFASLMNIVIDGEERELVDAYHQHVVVIDPTPIKTTDFRLTALEKDFLVALGTSSALSFLRARMLEDGPLEVDVNAAQQRTNELFSQVKQLRRERKSKRRKFALAAALTLFLAFATWHYGPVLAERLLSGW
jgi:predicted acylesterase/phospholipase RssA